MFNKDKKLINYGKQTLMGFNDGINPVTLIKFIVLEGVKKTVYGVVIVIALTCGQVRAQSSEIISSNCRHVSFPVFTVIEKFIQYQEERVSDGVELFPSIPFLCKVIAEPSTKGEGGYTPANSPDKSNKNRIGIEQSNEITPEIAEHFYLILLGQLVVFLFMFPLGVYFSRCISPRILAKRKRWMKLHTLKAKRFHRDNPGKWYRMPRKTFCQWLWF